MATKEATDFNALNVEELKEKLRSLNAKTSGNKAELVKRLMEIDPSGVRSSVRPSEDREDSAITSKESEMANPIDDGVSEMASMRRELEYSRKERELTKKELELARREILLLQNMQQLSVSHNDVLEEGQQASFVRTTQETRRSTNNSEVSSRLNITSVAELLSTFDGRSNTYEAWERQVLFLKDAYKLSDDLTKVMIGSRLKGKALEWLHSRAEYIVMTIDDLLGNLKGMFHHRPSKILRRKQFEQRTWKRDETFGSYLHDKVIMANRIPIDTEETIEYIIEGIPDPILRDQARVQRLNTQESLLEAFEKISLRGRGQHTGAFPKNEDKAKHHKTDEKPVKSDTVKTVKRCHNCGLPTHYAIDCPMKGKGRKCFKCQEFGHIAAECSKKGDTVKDSCNVSRSVSKKCNKEVKIRNQNLTALIDTGSDLSLMQQKQYIRVGSPKLIKNEIKFRGIGAQNNTTIGEFDTIIEVDGNNYPITICVVPDDLMQYGLLIGTDFLNNLDISIKEGKISVMKPQVNASDETLLPEIYKIDCVEKVDEIDLAHIVNIKQRAVVEDMIDKYNPVKTRETNVKMDIIVKDNEPVFQAARRLSPSEQKEVDAHVNEWLSEGIIQPSLSDYTSPVVLVKKNSGGTRLCIDYRQLNKRIIKVRFPLPLIEDQIDALEGASVFSTLDLKNGFFHVPIEPESRKFTSFVTRDGQFEFLYVPFGLCNSPAIFQKYIYSIYSDLIKRKKVLIYIDDFIIFSKDCDTNLEVLREVLYTAEQFGLKFNWKKCRFLQSKIEFLGHVIENNTVRPTEKKTEAVLKFPQPSTVKQNQGFLGLTGYFRKYIPNYSLIARPLTNLLKSDVKFHFGEREKIAFNQLKTILCSRPVLRLYNPKAHTELHTDASIDGYGAILLQRDSINNALYPVYYASGKTSLAERNYTSYELEVLAIVKSLKKFRIYLLGIPFKIITDCQAFSLTMSKKDLCVRVARWALLLEEFEYVIEHRSSKRMLHVDALSRNPLPSIYVITESEESVLARIRKAQQEDSTVKKLFQLAERQMHNNYIVKNGLLYKEVDDDLLLVLPRSMQFQIIRQVHEAGHFAVGKTEAIVKRDYWFSNMRPIIEKVIQNCVSCILAEKKHGKQEGWLHTIDKGSIPLDTYHIDHLGPLPTTKKQYRHILVMIDSFSKFTWLYASRSTGTTEVLDKLKKQASTFGNPRRIISDRGTSFTSHEFKQYCQEENIQHVLITTGVPRANGQVERVNRTLIPLLSKLSAPNPGEWHKYLELCQKYLNATPHKSTGNTPFKLLFGTNIRIKEDPGIKELVEEEWIKMFEESREELRAEAKKNILKIQQENRKNYNKRRKKPRRYKENDLVAIKRTQLGPGLKLASKFLGPYQITRVLRNDKYMVKKVGEAEGPLETTTSIDHMKPWRDNAMDYSPGENDNSEESHEEEDTNI